MLTWNTARCESCGEMRYPQWRLCAKCDPICHSEKPVAVELAGESK
jgi:uncharacterized OB-fold protein